MSRPAHAQRDHASGISAFAFQPRFGMPGAFISVSWNRPDAVPSSFVLGYVVWRADLITPLQIVGGLDTDARRRFLDHEGLRNVVAFDGPPGEDAGSRSVIQNVPGLVPGQQYRYQVAAAYRNGLQDRDQDGLPDVGAQFMSPLSAPSRFVTAIAPPAITGIDGVSPTAAPPVDLSAVTVEWLQAPGADTYVIWASTDPAFRRKRKMFKVGKSVPVEFGGPDTLFATINLNQGAFRRASRIYISVGARRSGEPKPRPFGAIFSPPVAVEPLNLPPGAP